MCGGRFHSFANQVHVGFGCFHAVCRFLLEAVQDIHGIAKPNGIDRPVRVAPEILDNLKNAGASEAFERLGLLVLPAFLGKMESVAKTSCTSSGKALKSFREEATQWIGFGGFRMVGLYPNGTSS
jgi:hypothetical protein